jgi:iron complex outermembrane receptor protein
MMQTSFQRRALCLALAAAFAALPTTRALAQQTVVITGNPLGRDNAAQPVSVLSGDALAQRRGGTLGETLDGLPGVSATYFGPNASRPVIRGLDGDRVRLLDNGGASVDASNLSFDHAAASDPLVTERIEVLRGPAALLYGGNATGGVVNSIDNRIPRGPAVGLLTGRAEVRFGGAANEKSAAAVVEGGATDVGRDMAQGGLAWHADAYGHRGDDVRAPRYTPVAGGVALPATDRIRNSASRGEGGALGTAWTWGQGFLGLAAESSRSIYGTTIEPEVRIHMNRERASVAGEWRGLAGPITQVSAQASRTRYKHQEVDGQGDAAAIGTTFLSTGDEARVQAHHAPLTLGVGTLAGVWGVQAEQLDFQALGSEAFVPPTLTRTDAAFALEEMAWSRANGAAPVVLSAGARIERVSVFSSGDAPGAVATQFGAAQTLRYTPGSYSLGLRWGPASGWQLQASVGRTQRAPAYYELFANGQHVATGTFERGDTALGAENSRHAELGLSWTQGRQRLKANVFQTTFSRFIALDDTGTTATTSDGTSLPVYAFHAARVRMQGLELEGETLLLAATAARPWTLDLTAGLDTVRGDNLDRREPLARLAPLRVHLGLQAGGETLKAGVNWRGVARQSRVPATDTATPGYAMLDLWLSGKLDVPGTQAMSWFARLGNLGDHVARSASTVATMRGLAPLPGRALTVGLRGQF